MMMHRLVCVLLGRKHNKHVSNSDVSLFDTISPVTSKSDVLVCWKLKMPIFDILGLSLKE